MKKVTYNGKVWWSFDKTRMCPTLRPTQVDDGNDDLGRGVKYSWRQTPMWERWILNDPFAKIPHLEKWKRGCVLANEINDFKEYKTWPEKCLSSWLKMPHPMSTIGLGSIRFGAVLFKFCLVYANTLRGLQSSARFHISRPWEH